MGGRWAHRNQKWNQTFNEFALTRLKAATQSLAIVQSLDHPCNKNPRVFFHPLSYFPLWITHFIEAFPSTLRRNSKNRIQNFPSASPLRTKNVSSRIDIEITTGIIIIIDSCPTRCICYEKNTSRYRVMESYGEDLLFPRNCLTNAWMKKVSLWKASFDKSSSSSSSQRLNIFDAIKQNFRHYLYGWKKYTYICINLFLKAQLR